MAKSSKLLLRPLAKSDNINVCRWMISSYILQHSFVIPGPKSLPNDFATKDYAFRYFDMLLSDPKRLSFAIVIGNVHIGNIGLKEICPKEMTAECFIEIGDAFYRGQGFGSSAMKQLLNIAFCHKLTRVDLDVLEFNFPALKVYDRLGFVKTGQSGWHYDEFGQYWQVLRMSIKKRDWVRNRRALD
jgi:RimJ/RimL family protein N-acetyltransferase